ncbi:MAG TPA: hypothetical protein VGQ83_25835 [Polyangia bacterium]|jgi:hypothetical protein
MTRLCHRRPGRSHRRALACALAAALTFAAGRGYAYDAATTHAGLTERAATASSLHRVIAVQLGRALGLFEPLRLAPEHLQGVDPRVLLEELALLDPAQGYRPDSALTATALGWLAAGSVLEQVPADRDRNHFYDPRRSRGLDNRAAGRSLWARVLDALEGGGTFGGIFTGDNFDLSGASSLTWIEDRDNALGLPSFLDARERAATSELPSARTTALIQALLAAGGLLHVLEDAGEPAHVRNDYRRAFDAQVGESVFDRTARLERDAALAYGRAGVPAPAGRPFAAHRLRDFFTRADGQGLAQRTQRGYFSPGSLPPPLKLPVGATADEVLAAVNASLPYPEPRITRLDLNAAARGGAYLQAPGVGPLAAYRLTARGVLQIFLDERTNAAYARALLPEVGRYATGLLEFLFRGRLAFERTAPSSQPGTQATSGSAALVNRGLALGQGQLTLLTEDARGRRRPFATRPVAAPVAPGAALGPVTVPRGSVRLIAVFRGRDAAGEPIVVVEDAALPLK